jgi:hypothetical protein
MYRPLRSAITRCACFGSGQSFSMCRASVVQVGPPLPTPDKKCTIKPMCYWLLLGRARGKPLPSLQQLSQKTAISFGVGLVATVLDPRPRTQERWRGE